jgi:hypothetical protein
MGDTKDGLGPNIGGNLEGIPNVTQSIGSTYGTTEGRFKWSRGRSGFVG